MHKCRNCGQEFEGNFCPNCGTPLNGSHAATKTQSGIIVWIKAHLKAVIAIAISLVVAIVFISLIPTFILASKNGTYYLYIPETNEIITERSYTLKTGKWTDEAGNGNTYKVNGKKVILYDELFGEKMEFLTGTISDGVFKVDMLGTKTIYISKKHRHKFGGWTDENKVSCTVDGTQVRLCSTCGGKETKITQEALGHTGSWETTKEATCTEEGIKEMHCTRCGKDIFEYVEKTEHKKGYLADSASHHLICTECKFQFEFGTHDNPDNCSVCGYPFKYKLNSNNSYSVIGTYDIATTSEITIPPTYNNLPVVAIGEEAFKDCSALTSITIPDSVTSIGYNAFSGCNIESATIPAIACSYIENDKLKTVTITSGVSICEKAFSDCTGITSITIPDSVTSIGYNAFSDCNIESAIIPAIACSFINNSKLKSVTITSGKSIGNHAFRNCSGLTSITIPDSVTSIGSSAFVGCSGLTSITIPDSVTSIGDYAFNGCSGLTSITIPDSVTSIGYGAFLHCSGLTSIIIPDGVTNIGDYTFCNCSGLKSITIPDSVTSIGEQAFDNCSGLTSITIPNSVTSIGKNAFAYCSGLTSIYYSGDIASWCGMSGLYNLAPSQVYIGNQKLCEMTSITIPNSVTSIGESAFSGCYGLTNITIPDSITSIGESAFEYCSGLKSITIPDSVTSIGDYTFYNCRVLTSITIPNSVTNIGERAFSVCYGLTSITIPDSVTSISESAFEDCSGLTSIIIPNSVTSIGKGAFDNCSGLTSINVSENNANYKSINNCLLTKDGKNLILGCKNSIIPDGVTEINDYAFSGCYRLKSITIPDSVTSIGESAFDGCYGLTNITIPDSVTSIGDYTFYNCSVLTSITIPNSVTSIGKGAFNGCSRLTSITYGGTMTQWKAVQKKYYTYWNYNTGDYTVTCTDGKLDKKGNVIE